MQASAPQKTLHYHTRDFQVTWNFLYGHMKSLYTVFKISIVWYVYMYVLQQQDVQLQSFHLWVSHN